MGRRENFTSQRAAVLAMAGSAIGLGNIWRFPYMVGQNGGAAFILIYILCGLFISLPIFLCESVLGRSTQSSTFGAVEKTAPGSPIKWLAIITVITPLIILSFYSVVGGWSIDYLVQSLFKGFDSNVSDTFTALSTSVWKPLLMFTIFLGVTALIVTAGVKSGIERFNNISMPVLFVLILAIALYSITLPGAEAGVAYLLRPDFSKVTPDTVIYALGQSFFSLSLGVGTVLTYASYMKKDTSLISSSLGTAGFDLLFAMIAGFAIMPAVFAAGIEPGAGPGLIFETLPSIFVQMGEIVPVLSRIISIIFFLTIVVAALTSSISMYEVGVAYLVEQKHLSRKKSVVIIFAGTWTLGALCSLSFGPLSDIQLFGQNIFGFCDSLTSNFLMVFGALFFVYLTGWKMDRNTVLAELDGSKGLSGLGRNDGICGRIILFFIRYIAPAGIIAIFLSNLLM